jgi:hypothetical protein
MKFRGEKLGNKFHSSIVLDLIPGKQLKPGLYQVSVASFALSSDDNHTELQHSTWNTRDNFTVEIGEDVYHITYSILQINSSYAADKVSKHFSMNKSDLIMLNLAHRLTS